MPSFWEGNVAALSSRNADCGELAERLRQVGPDSVGLRSRSGQPLPVVETPQGFRSLESAFDAFAEARRWIGGLPAEATLVVWGGAPPALFHAVGELNPRRVVVIEPRLAVWRSLFTVRDYSEVIAQPWWIPELNSRGDWLERLGRRYHPLWDGPITARDWRAATDGPQAYWEEQRLKLRGALDRWTGDFSTQARFGARWYRNTLVNLKYGQFSTTWGNSLASPTGVVVVGAGPGLEAALEERANQALLVGRATTGWKLLSTDTALPALTARGIRPDVVLVLDGQLPSSQHFHAPLPLEVPLLTDLASLPLFQRLGLPWSPFLSANPFNTIVERVYRGILRLDGSSGNVSGLALRFAEALGAPQVRLWGADLSYPDGKGYTRGTSVYPARHRRSSRLSPAETGLSAPCYGAPTLEHQGQHPRRYSTDLLRRYRQTMAALASQYTPSLEVTFPVPPVLWAPGRNRPAGRAWVPSAITGDWSTFRGSWRERLNNLPVPAATARFAEFLATLEPRSAEDWLALWPLALALYREGDSPADKLDRLILAALAPLQD